MPNCFMFISRLREKNQSENQPQMPGMPEQEESKRQGSIMAATVCWRSAFGGQGDLSIDDRLEVMITNDDRNPGKLTSELPIRSQEKGVLAKEVSVESSVTAKKIPKDLGPSSRFGTQRATAKRGVHFAKKNLLETPFLGS